MRSKIFSSIVWVGIIISALGALLTVIFMINFSTNTFVPSSHQPLDTELILETYKSLSAGLPLIIAGFLLLGIIFAFLIKEPVSAKEKKTKKRQKLTEHELTVFCITLMLVFVVLIGGTYIIDCISFRDDIKTENYAHYEGVFEFKLSKGRRAWLSPDSFTISGESIDCYDARLDNNKFDGFHNGIVIYTKNSKHIVYYNVESFK